MHSAMTLCRAPDCTPAPQGLAAKSACSGPGDALETPARQPRHMALQLEFEQAGTQAVGGPAGACGQLVEAADVEPEGAQDVALGRGARKGLTGGPASRC